MTYVSRSAWCDEVTDVTMTAIEQADPLLTPAQVAERLNVPQSWVYRAARESTLPSVKVGRWVRFRPVDIDDYIRKGGADDA